MARMHTALLMGNAFLGSMLPFHPDPVEAQMRDVTETVQAEFRSVAVHVQSAAEAVPAERFDFRPTDDVRSFAEIVAHLVDSHRYYCAHAGGDGVGWTDAVERAAPDRVTLLRLYRDSVRECADAARGRGARMAPLVENLGHTSLHYGNLVTYLRLMGITPPSSGGG